MLGKELDELGDKPNKMGKGRDHSMKLRSGVADLTMVKSKLHVPERNAHHLRHYDCKLSLRAGVWTYLAVAFAGLCIW